MATSSTKTATNTPKKATKTAAKSAPKVATKPVATAKAVATPAKAAVIPKATIVETVKPVVAGAPIKKPELIDRVMAETGMKKKDVKPVVEAMLAVLGRALTKGEDLTVPPLGKLMVKRTKEAANATIVTVKLRHPNNPGGPAKTVVGDEVI
ncbi:DNA-binding protein HU-alpha [Octadecabacter temperatus]|uniref:DNA-binding protein HU n=1 Tax=Octadecabacter temperatus TaxID=1458307 RepID=A0A0K0Y5W7_9RHOB|nr:HU family DNA-binding protein [Octadecabacter temperatus]AKS46286.1 DNA-binding protein HU [Octadecabacter temperatus]SIO11264.1 DNA-binding protein HU-alpha [Octadecabacter temperatus]